ncbi:MAG: 50S ribosomal protein L24 [Lachnospiraceae bacterium]|jgi:large subunit ribosomal protein L24
MATLKIKKGDTVRVIAGKDKDKEGKVLAVDAKKSRVIVEGINMVKKHLKPGRESQEGGIIARESPIDISNVMYVHKGQTTRIGFHIDEDGKKVRYAKSLNEAID